MADDDNDNVSNHSDESHRSDNAANNNNNNANDNIFDNHNHGNNDHNGNSAQPRAMYPFHDAIAQLRKYNGKSDPVEFLHKFDVDVRMFGYDDQWKIMNFDRVLTHDAKAWMNSVWPHYHHLLIEPVRRSYAEIWGELSTQFVTFFNQTSQIQAHRQRNRELKFTFGKTDPQTYVTSKMEVLRNIDANMSMARQVEQLTKGLPFDAQQQFALQNIYSPRDFLDKLRRANEICLSNNDSYHDQSSQSRHTYSTQHSYSANLHPRLMNFNARRNDNIPSCNYCNRLGHVERDCRTKRSQNSQQNGHNPNFRPQHYQPRLAYNQSQPNYQYQHPNQYASRPRTNAFIPHRDPRMNYRPNPN